jgi:hypothetical protein
MYLKARTRLRKKKKDPFYYYLPQFPYLRLGGMWHHRTGK